MTDSDFSIGLILALAAAIGKGTFLVFYKVARRKAKVDPFVYSLYFSTGWDTLLLIMLPFLQWNSTLSKSNPEFNGVFVTWRSWLVGILIGSVSGTAFLAVTYAGICIGHAIWTGLNSLVTYLTGVAVFNDDVNNWGESIAGMLMIIGGCTTLLFVPYVNMNRADDALAKWIHQCRDLLRCNSGKTGANSKCERKNVSVVKADSMVPASIVADSGACDGVGVWQVEEHKEREGSETELPPDTADKLALQHMYKSADEASDAAEVKSVFSGGDGARSQYKDRKMAVGSTCTTRSVSTSRATDTFSVLSNHSVSSSNPRQALATAAVSLHGAQQHQPLDANAQGTERLQERQQAQESPDKQSRWFGGLMMLCHKSDRDSSCPSIEYSIEDDYLSEEEDFDDPEEDGRGQASRRVGRNRYNFSQGIFWAMFVGFFGGACMAPLWGNPLGLAVLPGIIVGAKCSILGWLGLRILLFGWRFVYSHAYPKQIFFWGWIGGILWMLYYMCLLCAVNRIGFCTTFLITEFAIVLSTTWSLVFFGELEGKTRMVSCWLLSTVLFGGAVLLFQSTQ